MYGVRRGACFRRSPDGYGQPDPLSTATALRKTRSCPIVDILASLRASTNPGQDQEQAIVLERLTARRSSDPTHMNFRRAEANPSNLTVALRIRLKRRWVPAAQLQDTETTKLTWTPVIIRHDAIATGRIVQLGSRAHVGGH